MRKTRKEIKIFNIPIVCTGSANLEDYNKTRIEESNAMGEAMAEGYEIITIHSLTLGNTGYIAFVLLKEVEIVSTKQMEQEDLQSNQNDR